MVLSHTALSKRAPEEVLLAVLGAHPSLPRTETTLRAFGERSLAEAKPEARDPIQLASALSEILEDYRHGPSEFEGSIQRNWTSRAPPTHSR